METWEISLYTLFIVSGVIQHINPEVAFIFVCIPLLLLSDMFLYLFVLYIHDPRTVNVNKSIPMLLFPTQEEDTFATFVGLFQSFIQFREAKA